MEFPPRAPFADLVTPAFLTLVTNQNPTLEDVRRSVISFLGVLEEANSDLTATHLFLLQLLVDRLAPAFTVPGDYSWMLECERSPLLEAFFDLACELATVKRRQTFWNHFQDARDPARFSGAVVGMAVEALEIARSLRRYQPDRVSRAIGNLISRLAGASVITCAAGSTPP